MQPAWRLWDGTRPVGFVAGHDLDGIVRSIGPFARDGGALRGTTAGSLLTAPGWEPAGPGYSNPGVVSKFSGTCGFTEEECGPAPDGTADLEIPPPSDLGIVFSGSESGEHQFTPDIWLSTPCYQELIEASWGFLSANLDTIFWAMCIAGADGETTGCVLLYLVGAQVQPLHFRLNSDIHDPPAAASGTVSDKGIPWITFDISAKFGTYANVFCNEHATEADKLCAVIALSAVLLHELTHVCGLVHASVPETVDENELAAWNCSVPYLAGSYFARGAFDKYSSLVRGSRCCAPLTSKFSLPAGFINPSYDPECVEEPADLPSYRVWSPPEIRIDPDPSPPLPGDAGFVPLHDLLGIGNDYEFGGTGFFLDGVEVYGYRDLP